MPLTSRRLITVRRMRKPGHRYEVTMMDNKRTTIEPKGDKRYIRRDESGRIKESDDVGKSLAQDRRTAAKTKVKPGQGDRGDQRRH